MSQVHLIFGPQGAGKSTFSKKLAPTINGIYFSIDAWMWNLYGKDLPKSMNLKWIMERVERCEQQIWRLLKNIVQCGGTVVLDLGFTKKAKRNLFIKLILEQGFSFQLHYIIAPHAVRRKRVLDRNIEQGDTFSFEVTPSMFDFMEKEFEAPNKAELTRMNVVDTSIPES